jgi:signal transduction histidine kinase
MRTLIVRKLIVDERNELFDAQGMRRLEFSSDFERVREYAALVLTDCPESFKEGKLLEQQLSEIIKNGIKHGNRSDPAKRLRVSFDFRKRVRFIVEDDGGNSLVAALEYWNGGMIYDDARNKVGVVRWFTGGSG